MRREGDAWQTEITAPSIPDVYWYYFMVRVGGRLSYYGAAAGRTCGIGAVYSAPPPAYQLTVYDKGFEVPRWFQKSVMYQIFPDRFRPGRDSTARQGIAYHLAKGRRAYLHDSWDEEPLFTPLPGETAYNPCDYFGGTLKGIEASLDYLKSLGVDVLYLNPIFEAASNEPENANIAFVKVDIDANQDLAQAAGIQAVPTLMIAKQGEVIFQQAGALQAADLDDLIAQAKALDLAAAKAAQSGADQQA